MIFSLSNRSFAYEGKNVTLIDIRFGKVAW